MRRSGVANLASAHLHKSIQVTEDNHFKVSSNTAELPKNVAATVLLLMAKTYLLRLPAAFGIATTPFDKNKYSEEEEIAELAEKKRVSRSEALIRWRWKRNADGTIVRCYSVD